LLELIDENEKKKNDDSIETWEFIFQKKIKLHQH
jgi:hypothetical protein